MKTKNNNRKFLIILLGVFFAAGIFVLIPNKTVFAVNCDQAYCGDAICDSTCGETVLNCSDDCYVSDPCDQIYCGNAICDSTCGETVFNCSDDCLVVTNDPVFGSMNVSSNSVCTGNGISVALSGQDDDGMVQLKLMINDVSDPSLIYTCSGTTCSKTWNIVKNIAGSYKLTAKFFGLKPGGTQEVYSIDNIYINYTDCFVPTVDIKANGADGSVSIVYNNSANLTWTSQNANSCIASNAWSGTKSLSGSQSTGNLTISKTYTITCTGTGGSVSDSVIVNINAPINNPPVANAGPDKEIFETESVILQGSGSDPDSNSITYQWSCNAGILSNYNIAQPIYYGPIVSSNATYVCTLVVTDSHGASGSDSMNILVKEHHCLDLSVSLSASPNSQCAPLNGVDLIAGVSGTASGSIIYYFDCQNDGTWEKITTISDASYAALDLCNYPNAGNYTAKVRVQREGLSSENTAQINVNTCIQANNPPIANAGVDKTVYENSSVYLEGSGYDSDGDNITYQWSCNAGTLSNYNVSQPTYYAPSVSQNTNYVCTLVVTDSHGASGSDLVNILVYDTYQPPSQTFSVSLSANPSSGCVPLNGVDLTASVYGNYYGYSNTYYFDCTNDGNWEKIYTTSDNTYTAYDVCNYPFNGAYSAKVRVERQGIVVDNTIQINTTYCYVMTTTVNKTVRNLSNGGAFLDSISAKPGDVLTFSIAIVAGNSYAQNVVVTDTLPANMTWRSTSLKVDGALTVGNIVSGLNIGNLSVGQTKTITFDADIAGAGNFGLGNTQLTNSVAVSGTNISGSDTALITVNKSSVLGTATGVSTGLTNNIFVDSIILPLILTLILLFIFKSHIFRFEEWFDSRKRQYQEYKVDKTLKFKITKARVQEFLNRQ